MCTAPTKRIQFSWLSKRPARSGCPATKRITQSATTVAPAIAIEIHAWGTSSSDGRDEDPEQREQRERDEAGEALDGHRRERDVGAAGGLRRAG